MAYDAVVSAYPVSHLRLYHYVSGSNGPAQGAAFYQYAATH